MKCEKCNKQDATIHLTEIIKDVKSEIHLCEKCAKSVGLNSKLSNFSLSIPEMISFLNESDLEQIDDRDFCSHCGYSFYDYNKSSILGCQHCYTEMKDQLITIIKQQQNSYSHVGKIPSNLVKNKIPIKEKKNHEPNKILLINQNNNLEKELEKAIFDERYEDAAKIRDKINDIKNKVSQ